MYALRVAALDCNRGWALGPAARVYHGDGRFERIERTIFTGPLWRAECRCPVATPHDPPAEHGTCGLYALARGALLTGRGWFEFRAASGLRSLHQSFGLEALVIVEALGRTCHGETGVVRSALQVPQCVVPHRTGLGMDDELLRARAGVAEDLSARYECDVVGWDEFRRRLEQLVPGVVVRHVGEWPGSCTP